MKILILVLSYFLFFGCKPKNITLEYCNKKSNVDQFFDKYKLYKNYFSTSTKTESYLKITELKKNGIVQLLSDTKPIDYPKYSNSQNESTPFIIAHDSIIEIDNDDILEYKVDAFFTDLDIQNKTNIYIYIAFDKYNYNSQIRQEYEPIIILNNINNSVTFNFMQILNKFNLYSWARKKQIYGPGLSTETFYVGIVASDKDEFYILKNDIKSNFIKIKINRKVFKEYSCVNEIN